MSESKKFYKLFVPLRVTIMSILPTSDSNFRTLALSDDIIKKIGFSDKEQEELEYKIVIDGSSTQTNWNPSKDKGKLVEFTADERSFLVGILTKLNEESKMTLMHIPLYKHFVLGVDVIEELTTAEANLELSSSEFDKTIVSESKVTH